MGASSQRVERESLYEEVWAEPMTTVAARYGVSSSYLGRVCEDLNVPRPPRGYWAQLVAGKAPTKPSLPGARPGDSLEWSRDGTPPRVASALPKPPSDVMQPSRHSRLSRSARHALVVDAGPHFETAKELDNGYLRLSKRRIIDVQVSRKMLGAALDAANALFVACEDVGYHVTFAPAGRGPHRKAVEKESGGGPDRDDHRTWRPDRATLAYVGAIPIALTIFEMSEEVEVRYLDGHYVRTSEVPLPRRRDPSVWAYRRYLPCGRLCLLASCSDSRVSWEKQWPESRKGALKSMVHQIVPELAVAGPVIARLVEEANQLAEVQRLEWEAQMERWRKEEEERQKLQNITHSRGQLFEIVDAWDVATRIEAFFEDIERRSVALGAADREALDARLELARSLLGGVDALQRFMDWKSPGER